GHRIEAELRFLGGDPREAQGGGALELLLPVIERQIEGDVLDREGAGAFVDPLGAGEHEAPCVAGLRELVRAAAAALVQTMAHGASMPDGAGAREHSCIRKCCIAGSSPEGSSRNGPENGSTSGEARCSRGAAGVGKGMEEQ